ncbi:hypothetical protein CCAX7_11280 [Capsulimonas corticalis]|uniref:Uncharacterized protein n=1 Tax=Capsulimonas corticalis TaxID=2219043 RepID=A0A402CUT8_9BACT|nr:PAS domain-containing protein [Capsulimonas corticalis]BDI29077.1 hypothetical protein CCAX7_11280 [Capsulimonas corticalis]
MTNDTNTPSSDAIAPRVQTLYQNHHEAIYRRTDRLFAGLLLFEWVAGIVTALVVSPRAWDGASSYVHPHLLAAIFLGAVIVSLPVALALYFPGKAVTRHAIAVAQMLMSALLIHLTGGRIETHFHVFGSLAFVAFYRDWRVLMTATAVTAAEHLLGGIFWPRSIYGIVVSDPWRWVEHAGWVVFEDVFLVMSCVHGVREMRQIAERQSDLEAAHAEVERGVVELEARVQERTKDLAEANLYLRREVTHRRTIEEGLRDSEVRYRQICASVPGMVFQVLSFPDGQMKFIFVSDGCRDIYGVDAAYLRAHPSWIADTVHEDDRADFERTLRLSTENAKPWRWQGRLQIPNGGVVWIRGGAHPEQLADGSIFWDGVLIDITDLLDNEPQTPAHAGGDAMPEGIARAA